MNKKQEAFLRRMYEALCSSSKDNCKGGYETTQDDDFYVSEPYPFELFCSSSMALAALVALDAV